MVTINEKSINIQIATSFPKEDYTRILHGVLELMQNSTQIPLYTFILFKELLPDEKIIK